MTPTDSDGRRYYHCFDNFRVTLERVGEMAQVRVSVAGVWIQLTMESHEAKRLAELLNQVGSDERLSELRTTR